MSFNKLCEAQIGYAFTPTKSHYTHVIQHHTNNQKEDGDPDALVDLFNLGLLSYYGKMSYRDEQCSDEPIFRDVFVATTGSQFPIFTAHGVFQKAIDVEQRL